MAMTLKQMQEKNEVMRNRYNLLIEIIKKSPKLVEKVGKVMKHIPYQFELEFIAGSFELPLWEINEAREVLKKEQEKKADEEIKQAQKAMAPQTNEVTQQAELK